MIVRSSSATMLLVAILIVISVPALAQSATEDAQALKYARSAGPLPANELEYGRALKKVYEVGYAAGRESVPVVQPGVPSGGYTAHKDWIMSFERPTAGGITHMEVREVDGKLVAFGNAKAEPWVLTAEQLGNLLKEGALSKKYDTTSGKPFWSGPGLPPTK